MIWQAHSKFQERQAGISQMVLNGAANLKLMAVSDATLDPDTVQTTVGLTQVALGTAYTGPIALTGVTCALDVSNNLILDMTDVAAIAQDAGAGFSNAQNWVIYESTTNYVIASAKPDVVPFGNIAGPVDLDIDPSGVLQLTI